MASIWASYRFKDLKKNRAAEASYWQDQIELWIAHSSEPCYRQQLRIEAELTDAHTIDQVAKAYAPLVSLAVKEMRRELADFRGARFSKEDVCTELARNYRAGYRREA